MLIKDSKRALTIPRKALYVADPCLLKEGTFEEQNVGKEGDFDWLDEDSDLELHWDDEVDDVNVKNADELVKWGETEISTSVGEDFSEAISDVLNQIDLEGEKDVVESEDEPKNIGSSLDIEAYKRGFLAGSRQLIGIDGCHLKGFQKGGQLLAAVGVLKRVFWAACKATTQPQFKQHIEAMQVLNPKAAELKIGGYIAYKSNDEWWEVEDDDLKLFRVHQTSCSCRRWDLTDIPCVHAIFAIFENGQDPIKYTNWFYLVEAYLKSYEPAILPISSSDQW
nr:uncharacterized protein LOC109177148 [Ipomoea batatas]